MKVRERLALLFDEGGAEVEDGAQAGYLSGLPNDGIVTVFGKVLGAWVGVVASDPSVKGGSWGRLGSEKMIRFFRRAEHLKTPIVYLIDSTGLRIEAEENFLGPGHAPRVLYEMAGLSGRLPQVCAVLGAAIGGVALVPGVTDATVFIRGKSKVSLGPSRIVKDVIGEAVDEAAYGTVVTHNHSGLTAGVTDNEQQAIAWVRNYLSYVLKPLTETRDAAPALDSLPADLFKPFDVLGLISLLADEGTWFPLWPEFAPEMATGWMRIEGRVVGVMANQSIKRGGIIMAQTTEKARRFLNLCESYRIPLLSLADTPGFYIGEMSERAGIVIRAGELIRSLAKSTIPRITVIVRKAYGAGYLGMGGSPSLPSACLVLEGAAPAPLHSRIVERFFGNQGSEDKPGDAWERSVSEFHFDAGVGLQTLRSELSVRFSLVTKL